MDKSFFDLLFVPIIGFGAYLERTKVSRQECTECKTANKALLTDICEDVKYIRSRLDSHLDRRAK